MNKDPVFRSFIIIILGIILFQMIFNLITGGSSMHGMSSSNMMNNTTSSLDNLVTGLMVLLIKLLMIALLIAIIIGVVIWLKKTYFSHINLSQLLKQNPILKSILSISGVIIALLFLIYVYNYLINPTFGFSNSLITSDNMMENNTGGFNGALGIAGVFTFLIKILIYVFVISLIISLLAFLKKQLEESGIQLFKTTDNSTEKETKKDVTVSKETLIENIQLVTDPEIKE